MPQQWQSTSQTSTPRAKTWYEQIPPPNTHLPPADLPFQRPSRQTLTTAFSARTGITLPPASPPPSLMSNLTIYQRYMLDHTGRDPWHTKIIITLTNTFDSYLHAMQIMQNNVLLSNRTYEIRVNPKSFDFEYCRQLFGRSRYASDPLVDAVEEMLGRYV